MTKKKKRPSFAAMANDAKRFLGLRTDIRELINVCNEPSSRKCILKTLQHPVLDQLHEFLLIKLNGGK